MSVLAANYPTLMDLKSRMDPDGSVSAVIEILNEMNPILDDIPWVEGNLPTGHRFTVRTGIPAPTWRKIYGGVAPTKSTTAQVTASCGSLEAYAEVDKKLADLNGNTMAFRLSENLPHIEGMAQEVASSMFYASEALAPEEITGISYYYNARSGIESAENVIHGGSSDTDNASIWLIVWGPGVHGIYPKGSQAGLSVEDKGQVTLETAVVGSGRMEAYRTHYLWDCGLCVPDWRQAVRICNIDKSALTYNAATGANLPNLMFEAIETVHDLNMGRPVFYMSRSVLTKLRQQVAAATSSSTLEYMDVGGIRIPTFHGIPVRQTDALAADESLVPA